MMPAYVKYALLVALCAAPAILIYALVPAQNEVAWKAIRAGGGLLSGVSVVLFALGALARRRQKRDAAER